MPVTTLIMMNMDDTLDEENVFNDLFMSWVFKSRLCKSRSREKDFFSNSRCNEIPTCVTCHIQLRMRTMTMQGNSYSSSFSFF